MGFFLLEDLHNLSSEFTNSQSHLHIPFTVQAQFLAMLAPQGE